VLSKKDMDSLAKAVEKHLPSAGWLLLCGSLPPGVDSHFYALLIESATHHGVQTLLDTDGDALLYGIEAGPTLASPNQSEAERLLNRALITRSLPSLTQPSGSAAVFMIATKCGARTPGADSMENVF